MHNPSQVCLTAASESSQSPLPEKSDRKEESVRSDIHHVYIYIPSIDYVLHIQYDMRTLWNNQDVRYIQYSTGFKWFTRIGYQHGNVWSICLLYSRICFRACVFQHCVPDIWVSRKCGTLQKLILLDSDRFGFPSFSRRTHSRKSRPVFQLQCGWASFPSLCFLLAKPPELGRISKCSNPTLHAFLIGVSSIWTTWNFLKDLFSRVSRLGISSSILREIRNNSSNFVPKRSM